MDYNQATVLSIIAKALWNKPSMIAVRPDAWDVVCRITKEHAITPIVWIGLSSQKKEIPVSNYKFLRSEALSSVFAGEQLMIEQDRILAAFNNAGIQCAVLKGSSMAALYPSPEMRSLGDIDLLVPAALFERASVLLQRLGFQAQEKGHSFHTEFHGRGCVVELHRAVSNMPNTAGGLAAARIMDECWDDIKCCIVGDYSFPALGIRHQALNLLLHMERHLAIGGIGLRQLCDWLVFVWSVKTEEFESIILPTLDCCGLSRFACVLTKVCVTYLGIDENHVRWCMGIEDSLVRAMMKDILRVGDMGRTIDSSDMSGLLIGRTGGGNPLQTLINNMNKLAKKHFPIVDKYPVFMPFIWVYLPLRYWVRALIGKRPHKSVAGTLVTVKHRTWLLHELKLFDTER